VGVAWCRVLKLVSPFHTLATEIQAYLYVRHNWIRMFHSLHRNDSLGTGSNTVWDSWECRTV
jgi:hypothetical protein